MNLKKIQKKGEMINSCGMKFIAQVTQLKNTKECILAQVTNLKLYKLLLNFFILIVLSFPPNSNHLESYGILNNVSS